MSEKLRVNDEHYDAELVKLRNGELAYYGSEASKISRYETFVKHVDFKGKKVLDIGAGPGIFLEWLEANDQKPALYVGTDIHVPSIDYAKDRYDGEEGVRFYAGSLTDPESEVARNVGDGYDIVIASGLFALKVGSQRETQAEWEDHMEVMLAKTAMTGICMVTNLSPYKGQYHADEFLLYPEDVLKFGMRLTERVMIDATYAKHDFMLIMQKGDNLYHQIEQREQ